ncbi:MAG TPA: hypothetical protein VFF33_01100 [Ignavibacteriaceae bacterium]|nr:hypothetical protein [Ignavibacteriaceae bacterium]
MYKNTIIWWYYILTSLCIISLVVLLNTLLYVNEKIKVVVVVPLYLYDIRVDVYNFFSFLLLFNIIFLYFVLVKAIKVSVLLLTKNPDTN